jgi:hypothetical protein
MGDVAKTFRDPPEGTAEIFRESCMVDAEPNEFYTPAYVIEAARACMGGIDLDPASCATANETVRGALLQPQGRRAQAALVRARVAEPALWEVLAEIRGSMRREFEARRIDKAILLLRANHVPTGAFCKAMRVDILICFPRRRVNFDSFKVSSATQRRSLGKHRSRIVWLCRRDRFFRRTAPCTFRAVW